MASLMQVNKFNDCLKNTIALLQTEYPSVTEISNLARQAKMALSSKNKRMLYEAFRTHIKDIYGAKILASDDTFIDDAKRQHSDNSFLPCFIQCWEQPGAVTKNALDLQVKLITRLQQLCDACV